MADVLQHWVNLFRAKVHSLSASSPTEAEQHLRTLAEKTRLVSALVRAGLPPRSAAEHAELAFEKLSRAQPSTPEAFLSDVWSFALTTGAAPAAVLEVCGQALSEAAENARQARVHLAGPQAATRLVMVLPLLALAGGVLAGYDPLKFLLGSLLGWGVLFFAAGMVFVSHSWSQRMLTRAQRWNWSRGMAAEVMALSLTAGESLSHARRWASEVAEKYSTHAEISCAELAQCDRFVQLASHTGVALSSLLRAQAHLERNLAREEAQMRVEKLSVQLMIPLGVCVLPAFIAVGVLPLVASVISSTALNS